MPSTHVKCATIGEKVKRWGRGRTSNSNCANASPLSRDIHVLHVTANKRLLYLKRYVPYSSNKVGLICELR